MKKIIYLMLVFFILICRGNEADSLTFSEYKSYVAKKVLLKNGTCIRFEYSETIIINFKSNLNIIKGKIYKFYDGGSPSPIPSIGVYLIESNGSTVFQNANFNISSVLISGGSIAEYCLDYDSDGVLDSIDNCPNIPNSNQNDRDNDNIGDVCDNQDNRDSDGDGLQNWEDDCPNESGPISNNGCPEIPKYPDLSIDLDDSRVRSACVSCSPFLDSYLNDNKRYLIQNGTGQIHFDNLEVRNIGESTSNSAVVKIYFSTNATLGSTDKELKNITMPARNVNSSYGVDAKINGWDFYSNNNLASGNYYLLIKIDATNTNNEGSQGESNNFVALPFRYEDTTKKPSILLNQSFEENTRYSVDIYRIDGIKVQSKNVNNRNEETFFVNQLPKGFFIVKNGKETYKVSN